MVKNLSKELHKELFEEGNPRRHCYHTIIMLPAFIVVLNSIIIYAFGLLKFQVLLVISVILSIIFFLFMHINRGTMYSKADKLKAYLPMFITSIFFFILGLFITQPILPQAPLLQIGVGLIVAISILVFIEFSVDYKKIINEPSAKGLLLTQTLFGFLAILFYLNLILFSASSQLADEVISFLYFFGILVLVITFIEIIEVLFLEISEKPDISGEPEI